MAYQQHRPDLIRSKLGPMGNVTLFRRINGLEWTRIVRPQDFLTPMEAAVVLRVHRVTMYDWIAPPAPLIPSQDGPHGVLLRWRDIRQFGQDHRLLRR